jgi:hypothetical protein
MSVNLRVQSAVATALAGVDTTSLLCLSTYILLPLQLFLLLQQSLLKSPTIRSTCRQYASGVKHGRNSARGENTKKKNTVFKKF